MYDRPEVELLLPAVWDETYAYGVRNPLAPDPDMPKVEPDVSHGNTLYAQLADVRAAWRKAEVPQVERQALFLRFGYGLDHEDIGRRLGVTRRAIGFRIERGVGRITAWLNGDTYIDGYDGIEDKEDIA
jgi:DNA-directed RNA polymerase specialized sigma24 family protein